MSDAQTPAFHLRLRDGAAEENMVLAGIWRRAWAASHPGTPVIEPIAHWLQRVRTEFVAPAEVVIAERDAQALAFMVLHDRRTRMCLSSTSLASRSMELSILSCQ